MIKGAVSRLWVKKPGEDWVRVGGRIMCQLSLEKVEINAGHMDLDDSWSIFIQGRKSSLFDLEALYIEEDEGQSVLLENAFDEGSPDLQMKLRLESGVGSREFIGDVLVNSVSTAVEDEEASWINFEIRMNNELELFQPAWESETFLVPNLVVGDSMDDVGTADSNGYYFWEMLLGVPQ